MIDNTRTRTQELECAFEEIYEDYADEVFDTQSFRKIKKRLVARCQSICETDMDFAILDGFISDIESEFADDYYNDEEWN